MHAPATEVDKVYTYTGLLIVGGLCCDRTLLVTLTVMLSLACLCVYQSGFTLLLQYTVEALFAVRKGGFTDYPAVPKELDLVERDDQITFELGLDDELDKEEVSTFSVPAYFMLYCAECQGLRAVFVLCGPCCVGV